MGNKSIRRYQLMLTLLTLTSFLGACNQGEQLKAVQEFSLTSESIQKSSALIIGDIHESCVRREELENQKLSVINKPVRDDKGNPVLPLVSIRENCTKWIPVVTETAILNNTLIVYIQSLGKLASENTITFTDNLQNLGGSVNNLATTLNQLGVDINISEKQQQAGIKIFDSLLNLWSSQLRYQNLKPAIVCTDPYFAEYTDLLGEVIQTVYLENRLLQEEQSLTSKYNLLYKKAIANSGFNPAVLGSTIVDLQNNYKQEIGDFDQRKQAAIAYIQLLRETKELHGALANNFQNQGVNDDLCKNYFRDTPNQTTTENLPTEIPDPPTNKELTKANRLIKDYQKKVRPLISKINYN